MTADLKPEPASWTVPERVPFLIERDFKYGVPNRSRGGHVPVLWMILAGAMAVFSAGTGAQDLPPLEVRLREHAPREWRNYRDAMRGLQGRYTWFGVTVGNENRVFMNSITHIRFVSDPNRRIAYCMFQHIPRDGYKEGEGELYCANSRYGFALKRNSPEEPWRLVAVNRDLHQGFKLYPNHPHDFADGLATAPLDCFLEGGRVDLLFERSHVDLLEVRAHEEPRGVFFRFKAMPKDPDDKVVQFSGFVDSGSFLLDPAQSWVILEYQIRKRLPDGKIRYAEGKKSYRHGKRGLPIIEREEKKTRYEPSGNRSEYTYTFDLVEDDLPTEQEFTLSAFGFIEPHGITWEQPTPWWLYCTVGGLGIVVLVVIVYRVRRWRAAAKGK